MLEKWHSLSKGVQWIIAIVVVLTFMGIIGGVASQPGTTSPEDAAVESVLDDIDAAIEEAKEDGVGPYSSGLSSGQENAVGQAESYLRSSAFSRKGLIEQLEYEGYSRADATYAVDNVSVDWYEQAALKARSYLSSSNFSRQSLLEQLLYEGFTRAQAQHGVSVAY